MNVFRSDLVGVRAGVRSGVAVDIFMLDLGACEIRVCEEDLKALPTFDDLQKIN